MLKGPVKDLIKATSRLDLSESLTTPELRAMSDQHAPFQMKTESGAIMCRVAPSFLRVGHMELFYRRAANGEGVEQL